MSRSLISIDPGLVNFGIMKMIDKILSTGNISLLDKKNQTYYNFKALNPLHHKQKLISNIDKKLDQEHVSFEPYACVVEGQYKANMCFVEAGIITYFKIKHPNTKIFRVNPSTVADWFRKTHGVSWNNRAKKKRVTKEFVLFKHPQFPKSITYDECDAVLNYEYAIHQFEDLSAFSDLESGDWTRGSIRRIDCPIPCPKKRREWLPPILLTKRPRNEHAVHEHIDGVTSLPAIPQ